VRLAVSRCLSACRRWLLGSSSPRWGVAPSSRSAYRRTSPDPNGVVMSRMYKIRSGRVPPLPRGRWCAPDRRLSSGRHPPLSSGQSLRPRCHIPSAGVTFTRRHRGFTCVHPSPQDDRMQSRSREARSLPAGLLLARCPRMEREPLRLGTPGFAPRSYPQSTPGRGRRQALAHWPEYYTYGINRTSKRCLLLHSCTLMSHVVAGGLHHHPLDTKINQMIGQLGQRPSHRRMGGHLLQSFLRVRAGGDAHTAHHLGSCRYPGPRPWR
jgi:hypothetical protein